jgi:hypothetical protein
MSHFGTDHFDLRDAAHVACVAVAAAWRRPAAAPSMRVATKRIRTQSGARPGGLSTGGLDS